MTGDNTTGATAQALSVATGIPEDDVLIRADGDALLDPESGEDVPIVTLRVGTHEAGVEVTFSADEAESLWQDLQAAIEEAHADVGRFSQRGGDDA